jgi:hypothetical protein
VIISHWICTVHRSESVRGVSSFSLFFLLFFFRVQFVCVHIMYSLCRSVSEYGEWGVLLWLVERFRRLCVSS